MLAKIRRAIEDSRRIFITTHVNPDGDAVGSMLALNCLFREIDRDVTAFSADPIPSNLRFLPTADLVIHDLSGIEGDFFDLGIVVDGTDWGRIGGDVRPRISLGLIINIDHHVSNGRFGDINLVDPTASAVGEMLVDVIDGLGFAISADTAACLYTAIMSDTGSFTYSNTTARAFEIAERLVRCGVRPDKIAEQVNENYSVSRLELLRLALGTLEFAGGGLIGAMTITQEMFRQTDAGPDMIEGFIDYPRFVAGVRVAVLFRELARGGFKVSFRSRDDIDVSEIAGVFGGGGHVNASGCTVDGELATVKDEVFAVTERALERAAGEGKKHVV